LSGDGSANAFALPVDAKQMRAFATDAQHKAFFADIHTVILVRDTANKWRDGRTGNFPSWYLAKNALNV
jgi:hypothetical protein